MLRIVSWCRSGMGHDVKLAIEKMLASGLRVPNSLMFACPWHQEAVEILKKYPETSVGIHRTLNAEWKNTECEVPGDLRIIPYLTTH